MYVGDFVDFLYFTLSNYNKIPNVINVGTGKDLKIKDYYYLISKVLNYKIKFFKEFFFKKKRNIKEKNFLF